jgi:hypothetical protein
MNDISKEEQIKAIIEGRLFRLLKRHGVIDPSMVDIRRYVTVGKTDIHQFLIDNPTLAHVYFDQHKTTQVGHDVPGLVKENDKYVVFWFYHGKRRDIVEFSSINEAVAKHIILWLGLY